MLDQYNYTLSGDHFIASILLPEDHSSGIKLFNRDPRNVKKKPDAYAGKILEASSSCELVKVGDNVVFERWEWQQFNLDDARIVARERELIVINDQPAPGYIVFQLEDLNKPKINIILPDTIEKPKPHFLSGKVVASGVKDINIGENYIFQAMDSYQYHYGNGLMAFRVNRGADILARYDYFPVLEVV